MAIRKINDKMKEGRQHDALSEGGDTFFKIQSIITLKDILKINASHALNNSPESIRIVSNSFWKKLLILLKV